MDHARPPIARGVSEAWRAVGGALLALIAGPALAQNTYTGPSKCVGCHDHAFQAGRWQRDEPARLKNKAHYNTRKALDAPDGLAYAKKLGLADTYDLKGPCVGCHSTVFRGDASAGVSCESCHGAASGYLEPHQVKGSYAKAVAAGMRDLRGKVEAIARVCVGCHVSSDKRLAATGHPTGADFDAGVSLEKIVHFETAYDAAQLRAATRAAMGGRAAAAPAPPAPAAPAAPKPSAPPATAGAPPPSRATLPPRAAAPLPAGAPPPAAPPAAAAEPAPWDWDQPIRPLPADYVPEPVADAPPVAEPPVAAPGPSALEPAQPPPVTPPPAARVPAPAPLPPPSIAEEIALPMDLPGSIGGSAVSPALAPAPPPPAPPPPPAGQTPAGEPAPSAEAPPTARVPVAPPRIVGMVELRGRAGALLESLLRAGARVPNLPAPAKPLEFKGADSELLRLQDEVLALALEALRRPE